MAVQKMQVVVQKTTFPQAARAGARDVKTSVRTDLLSKNCSLNRDVECPSVSTIFAHSSSERSAMAVRLQFAAKDGPEPHRSACRQASADAPQDACNEPAKAGCRTRPHLPAGAEIRERRQPHRGEPVAANVPYPAGAGRVLLRGRAERISATRL